MNKDLLKEIIAEQDSNNYRTEIDVSVHLPGLETGGAIKAVVEWQLDMELRSWGLKELGAYFSGRPLMLDFEVEPIETGEELPETRVMTLQVDMSQIKIEWERAGYMAPVSMDIYADANGVIDYNMSSVSFAYIAKE
jgi:hypothetical protein